MLMEPIGRRHEKTTRTPVDPDAGLPLLPKKRIAFAGENHDVRTGSVPVTSRISPRRILLKMGTHCVGSKVQPYSGGSLTSQASVLQAKVSHVGNQIGLPCPVGCDLSSLSIVVAFFTIESVFERKIVTKDEVDIAKSIDHLRSVGECDKASRLVFPGH